MSFRDRQKGDGSDSQAPPESDIAEGQMSLVRDRAMVHRQSRNQLRERKMGD